jgi:hypothetical protein
VKKYYRYAVQQCGIAKDKAVIEEPLKNILTNLIKLCKKFFKVSAEWAEQESSQSILADFYSFCGEVLQFRNPEVYRSLVRQAMEILSARVKESLALPQFS